MISIIPIPSISIKISGINTLEAAKIVDKNGANYIGFVFYKNSPKYIELPKAEKISKKLSKNIRKVGIFKDPSDSEITECLHKIDLDCIQLHGNETRDRVEFINLWFSHYPQKGIHLKLNEPLPPIYKKPRKQKRLIIKSIQIATKNDLSKIEVYEKVSDFLLFDTVNQTAKHMLSNNIQSFDWEIFKNIRIEIPFFLSCELEEKKLLTVIKKTGAKLIDISTGLENELGETNIEKITSFLNEFREIKKNYYSEL